MKISVVVNSKTVQADCEPRLLLSDFLRHSLRLTGTHVACEQGVCGACTVLIDGVPARSCLTLAVQADGASIVTVEGLASGESDLTEVQQAMGRATGLQCGFCTPGIVMSLTAAFDGKTAVNAHEVQDLLGGHLCRCTGYQGIQAAADALLEMYSGSPK